MEEAKTTKVEKKTKKVVTKKIAHGVGRRKCAVARGWLLKGKGDIVVNNRPFEEYFDTELTRKTAVFPISICSDTFSGYSIKVNIVGGGQTAQADAVKLGISRALVTIDPDLRSVLKEYKLLSVDSRVKERKKYGQRGARRKFQFVKR